MPEEVDYGPLALLLGTWEGDKGLDISPEPDRSGGEPLLRNDCL